MSPKEFRVVVADEMVEEFLRQATPVTLRIESQGTSINPNDYSEALRKVLTDYKKLLDSLLLVPSDQEIQEAIYKGYSTLLAETFTRDSIDIPAEQVRALQETFVEIFHECLEKTPHSVVQRGGNLYPTYIDHTLSPREVRALILRYGLADGKTRTFGEIGRELGYSPAGAREFVSKGHGNLRHRYPTIKRRLEAFFSPQE